MSRRGLRWLVATLVAVSLCLGASWAWVELRDFMISRQLDVADLWLALRLQARRPLDHWRGLDEADLDGRLDTASLQRHLRAGADFIVRMQEPDGHFRYWFDLESGRYARPGDDNFLRQAGTSYALVLAAAATGEPRYSQAARRSLDWQLGFVRRHDAERSYFLFKAKAKLGGIALPMLAMLELRRRFGDHRADALLRRLAAMIMDLQARWPGGQFKSTQIYDGDLDYEQHSGWHSRIYPGEAMLALALMYQQFGDESYRRAVDAAVVYYSQKQRWRHHAFLSWSIAAMAEMYAQTGADRYRDWGLQMADFLLSEQNLGADSPVFGSFHNYPGASTATYLEGLGEGLRLARDAGDADRQHGYRRHLAAGIAYLARLQVGAKAHPLLARGGVRQSLSSSRLRIDGTQHSVGALARALWLVGQHAEGRPESLRVWTRRRR